MVVRERGTGEREGRGAACGREHRRLIASRRRVHPVARVTCPHGDPSPHAPGASTRGVRCAGRGGLLRGAVCVLQSMGAPHGSARSSVCFLNNAHVRAVHLHHTPARPSSRQPGGGAGCPASQMGVHVRTWGCAGAALCREKERREFWARARGVCAFLRVSSVRARALYPPPHQSPQKIPTLPSSPLSLHSTGPTRALPHPTSAYTTSPSRLPSGQRRLLVCRTHRRISVSPLLVLMPCHLTAFLI